MSWMSFDFLFLAVNPSNDSQFFPFSTKTHDKENREKLKREREKGEKGERLSRNQAPSHIIEILISCSFSSIHSSRCPDFQSPAEVHLQTFSPFFSSIPFFPPFLSPIQLFQIQWSPFSFRTMSHDFIISFSSCSFPPWFWVGYKLVSESQGTKISLEEKIEREEEKLREIEWERRKEEGKWAYSQRLVFGTCPTHALPGANGEQSRSSSEI